MGNVELVGAFLAGMVSFFSPCILPLIPGYISTISGVSFDQLTEKRAQPLVVRKAIVGSLLFGLGFTIIFVLLGATATMAGKFLFSHINLLKRAAGILVIIFGLHVSGLIPFGFLNREKRFWLKETAWRPITPFLLGSAFAFGWTPCLGPILGVILTYASMKSTVDQGALLLATYSLGLGVPFFFAALAINSFLKLFGKIRNQLRLIRLVSGLLLVVLGLLVLTDNLQRLAYYLGP
ncbi:MAG: cytochrome c biogenesis CcdA family protein [Thermodesulfobacteriota bacterium]